MGSTALTITRMLSIASDTTFARFHENLQVAFGWTNNHAWQFKVKRFFDSARERREFELEATLCSFCVRQYSC